MTLSPTLLRFRLIAALLLGVAALQAMPAGSIGFERHHGSAFDISTVEVATPPWQRKADQGQVQPLDPPPLRVVGEPARAYRMAPAGRLPARRLPPPTGPPLAREIASLALAPRAPPFA